MDVFEKIIAFLKAQEDAEEVGVHEFKCPICGARAWWGRAGNGHLHSGCDGCGFRIVE